MAAHDDVTITDSMVERTAADFATLFSVTSQTNINSIEESIEAVLNRLDELYGMLDMIRTDSTVVTTELLPAIRAKLDSMNPIFRQIDQLEKFVVVVKNCVMEMDKTVEEAEKEFSALNSIKKAISGISFLGIGKKASQVTKREKVKISIPTVFVTSDYMTFKAGHSSQTSNPLAENENSQESAKNEQLHDSTIKSHDSAENKQLNDSTIKSHDSADSESSHESAANNKFDWLEKSQKSVEIYKSNDSSEKLHDAAVKETSHDSSENENLQTSAAYVESDAPKNNSSNKTSGSEKLSKNLQNEKI